MIQLAGSAHRSYLFPADLPAAFAYHCDLARSMRFLPHISIAERYAPDQFRLLYSAIDGLYRVRIYLRCSSSRLISRTIACGLAR